MKRNKALAAVLVAALSGSLLVGCTSDEESAASSTNSPPPPGTITVVLSDLARGHEGEQAAGVLLKDWPGPSFTGVAAFRTTIAPDPSSLTQVLGSVSEEWLIDDPGWPWPTGVANVPPGDYSLVVFMTKAEDMNCCYSRWFPAGGDDPIATCQLPVTATGEPQTITIKGGLTENIEARCDVE